MVLNLCEDAEEERVGEENDIKKRVKKQSCHMSKSSFLTPNFFKGA